MFFIISVNPALADTSLTLDKNKVTLQTVKTTTLNAIIESNDVDVSFVWTSSDEDVAIVNYNGEVTAIDEGSAIITVSNNYGAEASCIVNVIGSAKYSYLVYMMIAVALLISFIIFYENNE
ncbi:MAG: Ig-like domain-containing protein [Erysipelotrichaceae bacterium]|nr:Ig-like domain-containing protein [Erysipelotrichaceae bacterium]